MKIEMIKLNNTKTTEEGLTSYKSEKLRVNSEKVVVQNGITTIALIITIIIIVILTGVTIIITTVKNGLFNTEQMKKEKTVETVLKEKVDIGYETLELYLGCIAIYNEEQLKNIKNDLTGSYILMANIELTQNWIAIGDSTNKFTGTLEGNGYNISGLNNGDSTSDNQGLFGYIGKEGRVSNLRLEGIIKGKKIIGLLAGTNCGTIKNVKGSGTVIGDSIVGGLVGINMDGMIEGCYSEVEVKLSNKVAGGLIGQNCLRNNK